MTRPRTNQVVALLIGAACVVLVVIAAFSGRASVVGEAIWKSVDEVSLVPLLEQPGGPAGVSTAVKAYTCPRCGAGIDWGSKVCSRCGRRWARFMNQAALPNAPTGRLAAGTEANAVRKEQAAFQAAATGLAESLPSPRQQGAAGKEFIEGHWLGLEVIPLLPELATEYGVPKGETGVLVDEITLEAAESGILAGDVVQSIERHPTSDLKAFFLATQHVQEEDRAEVNVSRRGDRLTFVMEARNTKKLGFAQMEAAQPIRPGALSPHRSRSKACTHCHVIMLTGGQLPTDAGDILPNPAPISKGAVAPHGDRGKCITCHVVRQG